MNKFKVRNVEIPEGCEALLQFIYNDGTRAACVMVRNTDWKTMLWIARRLRDQVNALKGGQ